MANYKIDDIEGIGPATAQKLIAAGVKDTDSLLKKGCAAAGRKELAAASGLDEKKLLEFVNMADLYRIKGVGSEYAELLMSAGVDTVKELATRRSDNLTKKMGEVNEQKKLTRKLPTETVVTGWIDEAKKLPAVVTH